MKTKICKKCNIEKSIDLFFKAQKGLFGVRGSCKDCVKIRKNNRHEYLKLNKIEVKIKICTKCKKEKDVSFFTRRKTTIDGFRECCKSCDKAYYVNNKDIISLYQKKYRKIYHEKIYARKSKYYHKNKEKFREFKRANEKNRYHSDIRYKLKKNITSRMNLALSNKIKSARTEILLGCSIDIFRIYLESKFLEGMSWRNRSQWHIDHIIPCSSFDLSDPEQQKLCFHYTNLQPLWASDNLKKGNKLDWEKR